MMKRRLNIWMPLLLISLLSCSSTKETLTYPDFQPIPKIVSNGLCGAILPPDQPAAILALDSTMYFLVQYGGVNPDRPENHQLCIRQITDKIYANGEFRLVHDIATAQGLIEFSDYQVYQPVLRPQFSLGARSWTSVEIPDGKYEIKFKHFGMVDRWELIAEGDSIRITAIDTSFTRM